jgi:hypothetical protein
MAKLCGCRVVLLARFDGNNNNVIGNVRLPPNADICLAPVFDPLQTLGCFGN